MTGKNEFYSKAKDALTKQGYVYYDGDEHIKGKGKSHRAKPDYIACKGNKIIIGEIKSPAESPKSASWRQPQPGDSKSFSEIRREIAERERRGLIPPEIGGHEIIIRGQLPDYLEKYGITYELPFHAQGSVEFLFGYTTPSEQLGNVAQALKSCGKCLLCQIDIGNGSITFIFC